MARMKKNIKISRILKLLGLILGGFISLFIVNWLISSLQIGFDESINVHKYPTMIIEGIEYEAFQPIKICIDNEKPTQEVLITALQEGIYRFKINDEMQSIYLNTGESQKIPIEFFSKIGEEVIDVSTRNGTWFIQVGNSYNSICIDKLINGSAMSNKKPTTPNIAWIPFITKNNKIKECKNLVLDILTSPGSAIFMDIKTSKILRGGFIGYMDEIKITGKVDSQNGFGALKRSEFTCTQELSKEDGALFLMSLSID